MKKIFYTTLLFSLIWSQACVQAPSTTSESAKVRFSMEHKVRQPEIFNGKAPMLLLLHGLRSNEDDLFAIAPMLDERLLVVSVRAPFDAGGGRYKWYDYPMTDPKQAEESRTMLIEFIDQLTQAYNADPKRVYVLTQPDKVKGIASFSGNIPDWVKEKLAGKSELSNLSVFISHGKKDPVLPFSDALSDKDFLEKMDITTNFHSYETAHTMNRQNIVDFQKWISGKL